MTYFFLQNCSFTGDFQLPSHPNFDMTLIDVSFFFGEVGKETTKEKETGQPSSGKDSP